MINSPVEAAPLITALCDQGAGRRSDLYHFAMRALICGAGIAGLTFACLLDRMGWDVQLVERANSLRREGYMIDFFGPGFDAAETMGLLPRLRELAYTITELNYVDRSGRARAALDYQLMVNSLDGRLISLLRGDLALPCTRDSASGSCRATDAQYRPWTNEPRG